VETAKRLWYKQKVYICDLIAWLPRRLEKESNDIVLTKIIFFDLQQTSHVSPPKTRVKQHPSLETDT
jgi:hypothetical protein